jgi:glycosyltransferase involved in cell wall biosynthesis
MQISFYMPFKPLGHDNPSGDLITGTELHNHLRVRGHAIQLVSRFRTRWLPLKPWLWPAVVPAMAAAERRSRRLRAQIWLTYHTYYKAPDVIGPRCCRRLKIPYTIFQGIYSTKRRRSWRTRPGFWLNRLALRYARAVFTNKRMDHKNLLRLLPAQKVVYVPPGIIPADFQFSQAYRRQLRKKWRANGLPVVLTAAMFRPGVKTRGLLRVIRTSARIAATGLDFRLVIVGDGAGRRLLRDQARRHIPGKAIFTGRISRKKLHRFYSAADLFVFPGINESLGLVYLEAQACGLPVVAHDDWGAAEAVIHEKTGLLTRADDRQGFQAAMTRLITHPRLCRQMGTTAAAHVRRNHDLMINYAKVEEKLLALAG